MKKKLEYSRALVPKNDKLYKKIIISIMVILFLTIPILLIFTNKSEGVNIPSGDIIVSKDEDSENNAIENYEDKISSYIEARVIDPSKPMVALTFDDGPNPKSTSRILDSLEEHNVVATFFDIGYLVEKYPEIVKREAMLNCEIGNHTYSHINLNKLSKEELINEIEKSEKAFETVLGYKTTLYRPSYGNANSNVKEALEYPLILWSIDSLDWKTRDKEKILEEIRRIDEYDGKIILMHSIYESTADAVEILIPELINKGYQLVTVSEMAYYKNKELEARKIYKSF